jgi:hypothetical protein
MKSQKPFKNIKILQKKSFFISKIPLMLEGMILKILRYLEREEGFIILALTRGDLCQTLNFQIA